MNRRSILTTTGAALPLVLLSVGRGAFAQTGTAASTIDTSQEKLRTLQLGSLSLQTSQLALAQAQHPSVKQFAGFERDEQLTIAQVLTDTQSPTPMKLDPANAAMLSSLREAQGAKFDDAYVSAQLQTHQQLLAVQQAFLTGKTDMTPDPVHVAMLARTVILMHITMLQDIQKQIQA